MIGLLVRGNAVYLSENEGHDVIRLPVAGVQHMGQHGSSRQITQSHGAV